MNSYHLNHEDSDTQKLKLKMKTSNRLREKAKRLEELMNPEGDDGSSALNRAREKGLECIDSTGKWFENLSEEKKERFKGLKQVLDHSRVQLALAEMEAGKSFENRKVAFESSVSVAKSRLKNLESEIDAEGRVLWGKVVDAWDEVDHRMETAYLGMTFSEILREALLKGRKEKLHEAVVDFQNDLREHVGDGSKVLDRFLTRSEALLGKGAEKAHNLLHRFFQEK